MHSIFSGDYAGFDETQPTSSSGGKAKVVEILKESSKNLVFIGDGVTDMETSPIVVSQSSFSVYRYDPKYSDRKF